MRYPTMFLLSSCLLATSVAAADQPPLDCSRKSLAAALADAREKDPTITFTGICSGPIVIKTDGVTLQGVGEAIIDGAGQMTRSPSPAPAACRWPASRSATELNGIVAVNGAHVSR